MRLETFTNIVFIVALVGTPIYMVLTPKPAPPTDVRATPPAMTFSTFCHSARLVPKAVADCDEMMKTAKTDVDRLRVERTFAMGGVQLDQSGSMSKP